MDTPHEVRFISFKPLAIVLSAFLLAGCISAKTDSEPVAATPAAPAPVVEAPPEPVMEIVVKEVLLDATELFEFDSAVLSDEGKSTLDELLTEAARGKGGSFSVTGHTDRIGDEGYNMKLSERRANAVVEHLVGKGVPSGSISAAGMGETEPRVECDDADWQALVDCLAPNRRVVIEIPIAIEEEIIIQN